MLQTSGVQTNFVAPANLKCLPATRVRVEALLSAVTSPHRVLTHLIDGLLRNHAPIIGEQTVIDLQGAAFAVPAVAQFGQWTVRTLEVA